MEQIRYLKQQEKQNTRKMYEAIFSEDSKEFVDYYYQWKIKDNDILVMEDEKGYEVMMHFNPYMLWVNGAAVKVPYIVAVATRPDCRRQGKMQQVMKYALQDLQKSHCPFTFLLPADPAYYRGQGFVFAPEPAADQRKPGKLLKAAQTAEVENPQKLLKVAQTAEVEKQKREEAIALDGMARDNVWNYFSLKRNDIAKMQQAAETANAILAEQYDMYVWHDSYYYERLVEETASEQGDILLIEAEEKIIGILAYGKDEQKYMKEFLLMKAWEGQRKNICSRIFGINCWQEEEIRMMFRITDLQSLHGMLKGEEEILIAEVTDTMVEVNNGVWQFEWSQKGGSVRRVETAEQITENNRIEYLDISEITARIIGKMSIHIHEWV